MKNTTKNNLDYINETQKRCDEMLALIAKAQSKIDKAREIIYKTK